VRAAARAAALPPAISTLHCTLSSLFWPFNLFSLALLTLLALPTESVSLSNSTSVNKNFRNKRASEPKVRVYSMKMNQPEEGDKE
jgi:hypothetical protein